MNAMEILNRCRSAAGEIERLDQRIARYRACATDSSARIGRVGCAQGTACDPVSQFAVEIADCRQQRDQRQREYMAENYCACKLLDTLPETECATLYRYYLARKTVGEIACSLHFTVNYVKRKKAEAVARLEESILLRFMNICRTGILIRSSRTECENHEDTPRIPLGYPQETQRIPKGYP